MKKTKLQDFDDARVKHLMDIISSERTEHRPLRVCNSDRAVNLAEIEIENVEQIKFFSELFNKL